MDVGARTTAGHHVPGGLGLPGGISNFRVNESVEISTCEIAMNHAFSGETSAAKSAANCSWSIHQFPCRPA
jgi:hypothetical protein